MIDRAMAVVLAFDFVHFLGLTADGLLGGVVALAACLLLFNVMATDRPIDRARRGDRSGSRRFHRMAFLKTVKH